jgi:hypothetical protein
VAFIVQHHRIGLLRYDVDKDQDAYENGADESQEED